MTIAVSLPLTLIAFFVNDIGDYLSRLKSRRAIHNTPAHGRYEGVNQAALDHEKQKIHEKGQSGWRSLLRQRITKRGSSSSV